MNGFSSEQKTKLLKSIDEYVRKLDKDLNQFTRRVIGDGKECNY